MIKIHFLDLPKLSQGHCRDCYNREVVYRTTLVIVVVKVDKHV